MQALQFVAHREADLGVEVGERLVEQQHRRIDRQRPPQRDALALAAGKRGHLTILIAGKTEDREHRLDLGVDLGPVRAAQPEAVTDVLVDGHVRPERIGLEDHRHAALLGRKPGDILSTQQDRA